MYIYIYLCIYIQIFTSSRLYPLSTMILLKDSSLSSIFPLKLTSPKQKIHKQLLLSPLVYAAPDIDNRSRNRRIFCQALQAFYPRARPRSSHAQRNGVQESAWVRGRFSLSILQIAITMQLIYNKVNNYQFETYY